MADSESSEDKTLPKRETSIETVWGAREVQDSASTLSDPSWNTDTNIIHMHALEMTTAHKHLGAKISPACEAADLSLTADFLPLSLGTIGAT